MGAGQSVVARATSRGGGAVLSSRQQQEAAAAVAAAATTPRPPSSAPDGPPQASAASAVERDAQRAAAAADAKHRRRPLSLEEEDALEAEDQALGGMLARLGGSIVAQTRVPGVLPPERERETPEQAAERRRLARDAAAREGIGRLPPAALRELFELRAAEGRRRGGGRGDDGRKNIVPEAALPMLRRHGVSQEAATRALASAALPSVAPTKQGLQAAAQAQAAAEMAVAAAGGGPAAAAVEQRRRLAQLLQQYPWLADQGGKGGRGGGGGGGAGEEEDPPTAAPGVLGVASWPAWWEERRRRDVG